MHSITTSKEHGKTRGAGFELDLQQLSTIQLISYNRTFLPILGQPRLTTNTKKTEHVCPALLDSSLNCLAMGGCTHNRSFWYHQFKTGSGHIRGGEILLRFLLTMANIDIVPIRGN